MNLLELCGPFKLAEKTLMDIRKYKAAKEKQYGEYIASSVVNKKRLNGRGSKVWKCK